jgi:hypothetical protein
MSAVNFANQSVGLYLPKPAQQVRFRATAVLIATVVDVTVHAVGDEFGNGSIGKIQHITAADAKQPLKFPLLSVGEV